jgi:ribosomal protein L11 methyltransferase
MPWLQIKLDTTPDQAEQVSDLLSELGAAAVTFEDAKDQPIFEPDPGETRLWNTTRVVGLFEADGDMEAVIEQLHEQLVSDAIHHLHVDPLEDKDWERAWMESFKPIRCGERLWICPSWHTPEADGAVNVMLNPGLAFGTGTHPTTWLCLEWLDAHPPMGKSVIDFGCGSGILAVAAALLGATHVGAVDHDPQAILATNDNAEKNHVRDRIDACLPKQFQNQLQREPVDLMLANILANPLIELAPQLAALVKPGGQIVLSGILLDQAQAVSDRYQEWFEMAPMTTKEEWVRLDGIRR